MPETAATPTKPTSNSLLAISADNAQFVSELDLLEDGSGPIRALVMSPDGSRLAAAGDDSLIRLWSPRDGSLQATWPGHEATVNSLSFSQDGRLLASASDDGRIRIWDVAAGQSLLEFNGATVNSMGEPLTAVAFDPAARYLAASIRLTSINTALWDAATGRIHLPLFDHSGPVNALLFHGDGSQLAVAVTSAGRGAATVYIYDPNTGNVTAELGASEVEASATSLAFSGNLLAAGSSQGQVDIWNISDNSLVHRLEGHTAPVLAVAFSPDGRTLASGSSDGTVALWDSASGNYLRPLEGHDGAVTALTFRLDGYLLFSAGQDGTIRVWGMPVP